MRLSQWIIKVGGRAEAARLLGVTSSTIHYWLHRKAFPRAKTIARLIKLSKGRVTLFDVYSETTPLSRAKKKTKKARA